MSEKILKRHYSYIDNLEIPEYNKKKFKNLLKSKYCNLGMKVKVDDEFWIIVFRDLGFEKIPYKLVYGDEECETLLKGEFLDLREFIDEVEFDD